MGINMKIISTVVALTSSLYAFDSFGGIGLAISQNSEAQINKVRHIVY